MRYITRGLVEVLLDLSRTADPEPVTASLAVSRAGELFADDGATAADGDRPAGDSGAAGATLADLDPATPVFTDFYLPDAAGSVRAVFGVDLSTPPGQTQGRFVSHPRGALEVTREDDLHETVFVAAPPWSVDRVRAFDRSGRRRESTVLDAHPREEPFVEF